MKLRGSIYWGERKNLMKEDEMNSSEVLIEIKVLEKLREIDKVNDDEGKMKGNWVKRWKERWLYGKKDK